MIILEIAKGSSRGQVFESAAPSFRIGRGPSNALILSDYHLSGEHAEIFREDGQFIYRDLRSTNGSRLVRDGAVVPVDGECNWEVSLRDRDEIQLGDSNDPVVVRVNLQKAPREDATLGDRLIASRSIIDLPAVAHRVEHDPVNAVRAYKALQSLGSRLEVSDCLDAIVEATFDLLPKATHVAVLLRSESDADRFTVAASRTRGGDTISKDNVRASRAVLRLMLADRAAVLAADAQQELGTSESIMGGQIHSTIAIPLWRGDEIRGLIQADNRSASGMFGEGDLEVGLLLGSQAALALDNASLVSKLKVAEERLRGENTYLKRREEKITFENIIGESQAMKTVFAQLEKVVETRATVSIEGETGTGKELIASAVHYQSRRREHMFVAQNCAAMPESLLESELFGHRRGAFTSADSDKKGLFEIADRGTLFLDEVGEMTLSLQAKLLRVLQEGTIRAVGATSEQQVDVRIICATNRDLAKEVENGNFRQDLYYRLMVFPLRLPPLRERDGDVPLLANYFLKRYADEFRIAVAGIAPDAYDLLASYHWPGNIRELENEVQRLVIQCEPNDWVTAEDLSPRIRQSDNSVVPRAPTPAKGTLKEMMVEVERRLLKDALQTTGGNKTKAAQALGITREGLHKKLAKLGVTSPR